MVLVVDAVVATAIQYSNPVTVYEGPIQFHREMIHCSTLMYIHVCSQVYIYLVYIKISLGQIEFRCYVPAAAAAVFLLNYQPTKFLPFIYQLAFLFETTGIYIVD